MKNDQLKKYLSQETLVFSKAIDLIKEGASRDTVNNNGQTLLHLLVLANDSSLIPKLLKQKGDINTLNSSGHTAFKCLLMQQPMNFESVFLLMKAGADVTPEVERVLYNTRFCIDVKKLYLAIKKGPDIKNNPDIKKNTVQVLLTSLLRQESVNFNAVALLVFAGAGLLKKGKPVPSAIGKIAIIDTVNATVLSTPVIASSTLRALAKGAGAKEQVVEYIDSLPVTMQEALLKQALGKTPLNWFFGVSRGLLPCTKSSGTFDILSKMLDNLYPASSYTREIVSSSESSSSTYVPAAAPPPYNPAFYSGAPPPSVPVGQSTSPQPNP
ncbi:MAG: hypothetical protein Q8M03_02930 [Legionella sp.]|nr:hypothetical protein [Legionella sp.]